MRRVVVCWFALAVVSLPAAQAVDPPHEFTALPDDPCASCHIPHGSPGGSLTTVAGNANLCISCHNPGGSAATLPFAESDQAIPGPGLPPATTPSGNSHRWDSGPGGWIEADGANASPGTVQSGGAFTGRFAKTYTLTIDTSGDVGGATFSWTATAPGGGSGSASTGVGVALDEGVTVTFFDGTPSPSFVAGDEWRLYVRTDLNDPTAPQMLVRLEDGKLMCSTCHDQHSQFRQPFTQHNGVAPPYTGPGTGAGAGRLFQRVDNDVGQMCLDCHSARDVGDSALGSHPVGAPTETACAACHGATFGNFPDQQITPVTTGAGAGMEVVCLSCHAVHDPTGTKGLPTDGTLVRNANNTTLCTNCHQLADTVTPASHLSPAGGALWPGGEYGSTFPEVTNAGKTGYCSNCHQAHGWPDDETPTLDYSLLLVDEEEALCFTCHDGAPLAPSIFAEFAKASNHPLGLADGIHTPGETSVVDSPERHVECADCHNAHQATLGGVAPDDSRSSPWPVSGPLAAVRGVNASGTPIDPAAFEYELCFRCHGDSTGKPAAPTPRQFPQTNIRLEFDGSQTSAHSVVVTGTLNNRLPSLVGNWDQNSFLTCTSCHNSNDGPGNGGTGPNGPHGSDRAHLLERRYDTVDPSNYAQEKYALCFKCHNAASILSDESFERHDKHIDDASCNVCHDPHSGGSQMKLINFDVSVCTPADDNGTPRLEFIAPEESADGKGYCWVVCHNKRHEPADYNPQ